MNSRDFRMLFLYEWKSKHNSVAAARNIDSAFGNGSINEFTIRCWYAKFETGNVSLTKEDQGRPETVVDNEVLHAIVEKSSGNIVRDYAELSVSPTTISRHLKLIGKVKKKID